MEAQGRGEEEQALALMAWAGATLAGRGRITINTQVAGSWWIIMYLPSLQIQFIYTLCKATCRM